VIVMGKFKLQVQDDDKRPDYWRDVKSPMGELLTFDKEADARAKLLELYPVLVKLEQFSAGPKRTRVVVASPFADLDDDREK
jgi:hypothetical protein